MINPHIPNFGRRMITSTTESAASIIFTNMEYTCCPRPFKIASVEESMYIIGISGDSTLIYLPASLPDCDHLRLMDGVCYFEMNSAAFDAIDNTHRLYPEELHAAYRHAGDCIKYADTLYAIVTIEGNTIDIKGNSSSYYLGITHEMSGNSRCHGMGRINKPSVLSATIEL